MNERELIKKTLSGEEGAFDLLVQENRGTIFRHCLSLLKDEALADDITQETFVHAFQSLSSFQMKAKFSTWLWRIAHNLCLNYLKKHPPIEQEFLEELSYPLATPSAFDPETVNKIEKAVQQLSPKLRLVFEMYDIKHIPQKEIAALLKIPHGTVRSRLHLARRKMRQLLKNKS